MPAVKVLARDYKFEINTGTVATPVWTNIGGLQSFSFDPAKADTDTTDFDTNGYSSHLVASRSVGLTLEGQRKEDMTDGSRDAGQAAVEVLAEKIAYESLGDFRFYHKTSKKGKRFTASAVVTGPGGGTGDAASWAADLTVDGKPTDITVTP